MAKCEYCKRNQHNFFDEEHKGCLGNMFYKLRGRINRLEDGYKKHLEDFHNIK